MTRTQTLLERVERRARRTLVKVRGQRVLAILGMHRSGTSSLAGSLEDAGLYLGGGELAGSSRWNAKGNRESRTLNHLHEHILEAAGGAWDQPPATVSWSREDRARRDKFIRRRATQRYWGFKDPRTILVIDGWLEAIPDLAMVATIRNPVAVARSLQRRSPRGTLDDWLALWVGYNERLLELHQRHDFPIIDFDLPADRYQARLERLIRELGLGQPGSDPFFDASLRTAAEPDVRPPEPVAELYATLSDIAARQAEGQRRY